jgi:hypothetical protein
MSLTAGATSSERWRRRLLGAAGRDVGHAFGVCMDVIMFRVFAAILFAVLSLLFAPDSRDMRSPIDHYGSWAGLKA